MKNKRIKYFIKYGYFDCDYGQVISKRYHMFGEDPTAIYIKKKGFQVVFFVQQESILFAQIELIAPKKLKNKSLKKLMDYQKLTPKFIRNKVLSIYGDDVEIVVICRQIILYYHLINKRYLLSKIIPYHQPSVDLMDKVLTKIPFKNKTSDVHAT